MMLSAMAHPDLNRLLNVLLPFAELMSSEDGEFGPQSTSRTHRNVAGVALAIKWPHGMGPLAKNEPYRPPALAAAAKRVPF
jgi:hypothetical protein